MANLQKAIVQSIVTYSVELNAARYLPSQDIGYLASLQLILNQQVHMATGCL
jgi:threonine/homoserine efflux transporter RhtA